MLYNHHCHCEQGGTPPRGNPENWQCTLFTGLLRFTRNDKGDKEPGNSTPLSLRARRNAAARQSRKSDNVHYLLDCFTAFAMTKEIKCPVLNKKSPRVRGLDNQTLMLIHMRRAIWQRCSFQHTHCLIPRMGNVPALPLTHRPVCN